MEINVTDFLPLLSFVATLSENWESVRFVKADEITNAHYAVLVADITSKWMNAEAVLKRLDADPAIHPLIPLPRDGVRWSERK